MSKQKIALISNDKVGTLMAGPGMRYSELAKAIAADFDVLLLAPDECDLAAEDYKIKTYNSKRASKSIAGLINNCHVVISQNLRPPLLNFLKKNNIRYIADLYDPLTVEVLEYTKFDSHRTQKNTFWFNYWSLLLQLEAADHILCSSDRQKDFYLGILSDRGKITPKEYLSNPNFDQAISLAPFGLRKRPPKMADQFSIDKIFPQIKPQDKIVFWGGGIWDWFDPLTVLEAMKKIAQKRQDIKLVFLGVRHPNPKIKEMAMAGKALDFCRDNDLLNKTVFFNFGWTPYDERVNYLLSSTIGISTHFDSLETRFSFRTRVLDYLWSELPVIITEGDSFAELVAKHKLGEVVPYKDSNAIIKSIERICDDKNYQITVKANIAEVKKQFYWENIANNIGDIILQKKYFSNSGKLYSKSAHFYWAGLKKKFFK